ncbi:MAG: hypothetical protein NT126_11995 [Bacteroidetes bacterium]|nr:hypothetical protein [Bacteroidota bacterium]
MNKKVHAIVKIACLAFLYSLFLIPDSFVTAQDVKVSAKTDTNQIRIGEQFGMNLCITAPGGTKIFFPTVPDSIHHLEVVKRSKIDTLISADGKLSTLQQKLVLTSFDSGYYVIEPITFFFQKAGKNDTDSLSTEASLITVKTIPVDTTKAFKDIKQPLDVPFTFREALPYILGGVLVILLILLIVYMLKKTKKKVVDIKPKKPSRPAHEIALEALKNTENEKLWQQGFIKKYHSNVSDIIRAYIEHRFSVNAMEYTTDETLDHLKGTIINDEAREKLKYILQLADMVKFAKAQPIAPEHEQALSHAYNFIMLTKPVTPDDFKEREAAS